MLTIILKKYIDIQCEYYEMSCMDDIWKVQSIKEQVVIICRSKIDGGLIGDICIVTDGVCVAWNVINVCQKHVSPFIE